ncbi:MAG: electron transfer flavoprotein subunit alpha/FixB family protein [Opitutaceae bacterium]|nr:electron transfer flavoprotein subunit alpha/FixB family protein [Opitutaceae bacterium]
MRPGVAGVRSEKTETLEVQESLADLDSVPQLTTAEQFISADPKTIDLAIADRIVAAGRGVGGPDGIALAAKLAETLHASLGASRMAVDLGWVSPARQVGQTGRTVCPDLYVACGISGASHHLAGMRSSKHIIAINSDPKAPIHDVAHLSLPGDLHRVIPAVIAALQQRLKTLSGDPS